MLAAEPAEEVRTMKRRIAFITGIGRETMITGAYQELIDGAVARLQGEPEARFDVEIFDDPIVAAQWASQESDGVAVFISGEMASVAGRMYDVYGVKGKVFASDLSIPAPNGVTILNKTSLGSPKLGDLIAADPYR